jgi:RHS repeat-associated protein
MNKIFKSTVIITMIFVLEVLSGVTSAADNIVYYHNDALGSPVAATDQRGNIIWKEEYKPYGERVIDDPKSETNSNWFTGKAEEEGFGIQYFGARWYHQKTARFMSMDPVGVIGSVEANPMMFNRYAYANNNPYRFVDPDGREAVVVVDGSNVQITLPITYKGNGASAANVDKFNKGIEKAWSGKFGRFDVKTKVTDTEVNGVMNEINVPAGNGRANVDAVGGNSGTWPAERPAWTGAHEAGHLMGLADRYDTKTNKVDPGWENNIMGKRGKPADYRNIIQIKASKKNKVTEK